MLYDDPNVVFFVRYNLFISEILSQFRYILRLQETYLSKNTPKIVSVLTFL